MAPQVRLHWAVQVWTRPDLAALWVQHWGWAGAIEAPKYVAECVWSPRHAYGLVMAGVTPEALSRLSEAYEIKVGGKTLEVGTAYVLGHIKIPGHNRPDRKNYFIIGKLKWC